MTFWVLAYVGVGALFALFVETLRAETKGPLISSVTWVFVVLTWPLFCGLLLAYCGRAFWVALRAAARKEPRA